MPIEGPSLIDLGLQRADARSIIARAEVGAAGRIVQRAQLTSHRVTIEVPTLIFVHSGQKRIQTTSGLYAANRGDAIALSGDQIVDITNIPEADQTYGALWITWNKNLVQSFLRTINPVFPPTAASLVESLEVEFQAAYQAAFDSLRDVVGVPAPVAEHRLREVLIWLHVRGVIFQVSGKENLSLRVRQLIQTNPAHEWSIEKIARSTGSSPASLRRHLAAEKTTFRDVLQDVRMSHALAILQNTDSSILIVASAVGYESASRFAARFKIRFGYLPSEIRGHKRQSSIP